MSDCVNVRPCPACGRTELCDTHSPGCILCALSEAGEIKPAVRRAERLPERSWFRTRVYDSRMSPFSNLWWHLLAPLRCRVFGHAWLSVPIVGHPGAEVSYYAHHCTHCTKTERSHREAH